MLVKRLQTAIAADQESDLDPCPDSEMSKLKGDVAAADHDQPSGKLFQIEEAVTGGDVLGPWKVEGPRCGSGADDDVPAAQPVVPSLNHIRGHEAALPGKEVDGPPGQVPLDLGTFNALSCEIHHKTFQLFQGGPGFVEELRQGRGESLSIACITGLLDTKGQMADQGGSDQGGISLEGVRQIFQSFQVTGLKGGTHFWKCSVNVAGKLVVQFFQKFLLVLKSGFQCLCIQMLRQNVHLL